MRRIIYLFSRLFYILRSKKGKYLSNRFNKKNGLTIVEDVRKLDGAEIKELYAKSVQYSLPSIGLPEDVLHLLKKIKPIAYSYERSNEGLERFIRLWYAHLLSVNRYTVDSTFTAEFKKVIISIPAGCAVLNGNTILKQSSYLHGDLRQLGPIKVKEKLNGRYVSLTGYSSNNYTHWLTDIFPRVTGVIETYPDIKFILEKGSERFKYDCLKLIGIKENQVISLDKGYYELENFVLTSVHQRCNVPHRNHLLDMIKMLKKGCGIGETVSRDKKIYISRNRSRRRILIEEEVLKLIEEFGFQRVYCEDLSLEKQTRIFSQASIIMGPHGGGMTNQIFSEPPIKVIEIINPALWNWDHRDVINSIGNQHWFILGKNANKNKDMYVDVKKLDKLLNYAFDRGRIMEEY